MNNVLDIDSCWLIAFVNGLSIQCVTNMSEIVVLTQKTILSAKQICFYNLELFIKQKKIFYIISF